MDTEKLLKALYESVFMYGVCLLSISLTYALCEYSQTATTFQANDITPARFFAYSLQFIFIVAVANYRKKHYL